jgi:hypothetical protein
MFANSTTPNLPDYLFFLSAVAGIPPVATPAVFPTLVSTTTGGDTLTLIDVSQNWEPAQWVGYSAVDSTQNEAASIASNAITSLTFTMPLANPIAPGDQYLIAPDIVLSSLAIALEIVNEVLACASPRIYTLAVYNLATDRLINFAPDVPGQTFFQDLRGPKKLNLTSVSVGVPSQASDQGTATGILNPEQMKTFTLQDLQTLKTPWGRAYMGFASAYGPSLWGLS